MKARTGVLHLGLVMAIACSRHVPQDSSAQAPLGARALSPAIPLEPNLGQAPTPVQFLARTPHSTVLVTDRGIEYVGKDGSVATTEFVGGIISTKGASPLPSHSYYLKKSTPYSAQHFSEITASSVWPGISMRIYTTLDGLEFDFIVEPGADPKQIRLKVDAQLANMDKQGNLFLATNSLQVINRKPVAYQGPEHRPVPVAFRLDGDVATFDLAEWDRSQELVIDPLIFSASWGGDSFDIPLAMAAMDDGSVIVAGWSTSLDYPSARGLFPDFFGGWSDMVVTKIDATGKISWSTFFGGTGNDYATSARVRDSNIYILGNTSSSDIPITSGERPPEQQWFTSCFMVGLSDDGSSLLFSRYLEETFDFGGCGDFDIGPQGEMYLQYGLTTTKTVNTQKAYESHEITGAPNLIKADSSGNAYFAGMVQEYGKLDPAGNLLFYKHTDLGYYHAMALLPDGGMLLCGSSEDFSSLAGQVPVVQNPPSAFVAKVDPDGDIVSQRSLQAFDCRGITLVDGRYYVAGSVRATDPMIANVRYGETGGEVDAFVARLTDDLEPDWILRLGGPLSDGASGLDSNASGTIFVSGFTQASFPVSSGATAPQPHSQESQDMWVVAFDSIDGWEPWTPSLDAGVSDAGSDETRGGDTGDSGVIPDAGDAGTNLDVGPRGGSASGCGCNSGGSSPLPWLAFLGLFGFALSSRSRTN